MHHMNNLRAVDLNLLVILDALLSERHLSRAAERLHMSQPAVSHALARLRHLLGDPLLLRGKGGFQPMARALELARPLADAGMDLRDIEVQTLAGRQLPVAATAFLELLVAQLAP